MATLDVVSIDTQNLGDRSYILGRGSSAIVVDPQRDIDRVQAILDAKGWRVSHVLETHFHNDYVSGGLELARVIGAEYVVPSGMEIAFSARQVTDKDELESDAGLIRVLHSPGHTPNHMSFAVNVGGEDLALFTGGSLLYGSVGRTDLLGPELTNSLTHAQWHTMRRFAADVTPSAQVYPTHGFGSFCSASSTVGTESTLAEQIASNPAFSVDEETFVEELIAGLDAYPRYYAHMGPANQAGGGPIDLSLPAVATAAEIRRRIDAGEWVVDLRHRRIFAASHISGSYSYDVHGNAVTYLGWMIDWGTPITLIGETEAEVQTMQRELVRIGIDRPVAYAVGNPEQWAESSDQVTSFPRVDHSAMAEAFAANGNLPMIDLRRNSETENGYVAGAKLVPLHELRDRMTEVREWATGFGAPVWAYCGSGYRAAIGASFMQDAGIDVIHVDDDFPNAAKAGLPIATVNHGERLGGAYAD